MASKKVASIREQNRLCHLHQSSAVTIQRFWRLRLSEKRKSEAESREQIADRAARLVLKVLIGWKVRKEFLVKRNASTTIQVWKSFCFGRVDMGFKLKPRYQTALVKISKCVALLIKQVNHIPLSLFKYINLNYMAPPCSSVINWCTIPCWEFIGYVTHYELEGPQFYNFVPSLREVPPTPCEDLCFSDN